MSITEIKPTQAEILSHCYELYDLMIDKACRLDASHRRSLSRWLWSMAIDHDHLVAEREGTLDSRGKR